MNGWLVASWFLAVVVATTIWSNWDWGRIQRRVAGQRPSLDRQSYAVELHSSGVWEPVAFALYDALQPICVKNVMPHPDDGLMGFYFDDPEDMEDLVEEMFERLGLPMPKRYDSEATPYLESARDLAIYLQKKMSGCAQ